ncbi:hypothetical protein [Halomonas sp. LBP4]|uniref:hypothetical protein n=1 Tax=Halomonas sp. LBP4 TaxID=2044917 RepID=UPI0011B600FA|nr:hypothetical protein [Halomonas sp. LBP4]
MKNSKAARLLSGPFASAWVVIGSVLVGVVLSAFLKEIQESPPITWLKAWEFTDGAMTRPAIGFWVLFISVAVVAACREYFSYARAKHDRNELHEDIESVREVASTMPPKDFLRRSSSSFRDMSFETDVVYASSLEDILTSRDEGEGSSVAGKRGDINLIIRMVLDSMINLALHFDQPHTYRDVTYSANIMWLKDPSEYPDREQQAILWEAAERLSDCENAGMFFSAVDNLLVLDLNLTTNSTNVGVPEVDSLKPLCLGYKHGERGVGYNLPGAPQTLIDIDFSHVKDSRAIAGTMTEYGELARKKVGAYYNNDTRGRSIFSMPVVGYDPVGGEESVIAVVSIYRNSPGIMEGDQRALMFNHQMVPFVSLLYRLCWVRQKVDELEGNPLTAYTEVPMDLTSTPEKESQDGDGSD